MNNDRIVWTDDSSCFTRKNSPSCNTYLGASRQSMPKKLLYSHSREAMQFLNTVANHKRFIILPHFSSLLFGRDYIASIASTASVASIEVKRDVIIIDAL